MNWIVITAAQQNKIIRDQYGVISPTNYLYDGSTTTETHFKINPENMVNLAILLHSIAIDNSEEVTDCDFVIEKSDGTVFKRLTLKRNETILINNISIDKCTKSDGYIYCYYDTLSQNQHIHTSFYQLPYPEI